MTTSEERESSGHDESQDAAPLERGAISFVMAELCAIHALLNRLGEQRRGEYQACSGLVGHQRGDLEGLAEWLLRLESSLRDARNHVDTLGTALDRIKIVALNTGLEGARLGDVAGKALIAVSDELRTLTSRGLELLSEQASNVERMEMDRQRITTLMERAQAELHELEQRLRSALATEQSNHQALVQFAGVLQESTGLDVESVARLSRIAEQARELVDSLSGFAQPQQREVVRAALVPTLEPLLTWLSSKP